MKNNSFKQIYEKIDKSKRILLTLHTAPDGDSLGSNSALKFFLERQGKEVKLISYDELDETLNGFYFSKEIEFEKDILDVNLKEFDILITLDCSTPEMLGKIKKDFSFLKEIFTINIDHHRTNEFYGDLNYVDEKAPSACSILLDFFKEINIKFDQELSRRLLLGIYTDTNMLRGEMNIRKAFEDISFLLDNGADFSRDILEPIVLNKPLKMKRYFAFLTDTLRINETKRYAYSILSREDIKKLDINISEIRLGVNEICDIKNIDIVFTLAETKEYIKGSFRSNSKIDVSQIAKKLGGGGHKNAAAFRFQGISLEEAEKRTLEAVNNEL